MVVPVGPIALTGVDLDLVSALQLYARTGDGFWSDDFQELLLDCWSNPTEAVEAVTDSFAA